MDPGPLDDVDYERLQRLLAERGSTAPCPFCGHGQWSAGGKLMNMGVYLPLTDASWQLLRGDGEQRGSPAYLLTCTNCGFVRMHNPAEIKETPDDEAH